MVRFFSIQAAILIMSFIFTPSLKADVLKWVDKNGKAHYSDRPQKDADYEWVDDSDLITYSKQSSKKVKTNKRYRRTTVKKSSTKASQQPKPARAEGSSSSRNYSRGGSTSRY